METIVVTSLYSEIIEYYNKFELESSMLESELNEYKEYDIIDQRMCAYRIYESSNQMYNDNEKVKRYLTKHFSYLMKNVFYLDMNKFKAKGSKGSFFIYKRDAPVVKEILLRSVSQNEDDVIVSEWLDGKIRDNDYDKIVELSVRLFHVIEQLKNVELEIKRKWITALKLAIRTDLAYTMTEVQFMVLEIFSNSLPFKLELNDATQNDTEDFKACHSYFSNSILNRLNADGMNAQNSMFKIVYSYLETVDFDKLIDTNSFPPVELLQLKSVCEILYPELLLESVFPNIDKIKEYINYFISIDADYTKRLENRKRNDRNRYKRNKENF